MPSLIIHGGAGRLEGGGVSPDQSEQALAAIYASAWERLLAEGARAAVVEAVRLLEDDELFNAGTGSKLQRDGQARLSAALMDGRAGRFAGVINIRAVRNPILVAARLLEEDHRVLAGEEALAWARQQGFAPYDPVTPRRLTEYRQKLESSSGTVGAVAVDAAGYLCAATSTGGTGFEIPGRVSDSATVAGTYAAPEAGVSCTGIGEQIVSLAVAARVVIRVRDGLSLREAVARTVAEGNALGHHFGLIALDRHGQAVVGETVGTRVLWRDGNTPSS